MEYYHERDSVDFDDEMERLRKESYNREMRLYR